MKNRQGLFNLCQLFTVLYTPSPRNDSRIRCRKCFRPGGVGLSLPCTWFGQKCISWINILYTAPMALVRSNSTQSRYFPLHRGTRQGCPLSPLLFASYYDSYWTPHSSPVTWAIHKRHVGDVGVSRKCRCMRTTSFFTARISDHFTCLGIKVTRSYKKLFEANFPPWLECTNSDFSRWSLLPLSLAGRVNSIKMNTLLKFIFFSCVFSF